MQLERLALSEAARNGRAREHKVTVGSETVAQPSDQPASSGARNG